jgi:D-beta-D-heptose 7-phosphate kinase/D-beta-D-heptose 1-phosphate adenosyltransferase
MNYNSLFDLGEKKVLVIGDIMLDVYQYGKCNRISPEAPVPVVDFLNNEIMLGGAGNVLKNLVSFGANCEIVSIIGDDETGNVVIEKLKELYIETNSLFVDKTRRTTEKCRLVASGQQLIRIDKEDKHVISLKLEDEIIKYVNNNIERFDVIVFSDYLKGLLSDRLCTSIIKLARSKNILTLVDPKGANYKKYVNIDLIKPNLKEAEILLEKTIHTLEDIKKACETLKDMLKCKYVVITLAEKGIALFHESFNIIPTKSCQVYDVSGAGDTVLASLAICLKKQYSLFDACEFSNKAASIVIREFGSSTTTIDEVIKFK